MAAKPTATDANKQQKINALQAAMGQIERLFF